MTVSRMHIHCSEHINIYKSMSSFSVQSYTYLLRSKLLRSKLLKMAFMNLRKAFVFMAAFVFSSFCLFIKLNPTGSCISCQMKVRSFKRVGGNFLHRPDIDCSTNSPFLVILVTSVHSRPKARMAIRETWGKETLIANKRIVTYFLLGTTLNHHDQIAVTEENLKYGDIIQKDFIDTYYNLTLKTMMGIEWVNNFCPQPNFVMKADSDMFVNTYYLTELLVKKNRSTRFFTGFLKQNESPVRRKTSKWYVSKDEYPGSKYPPFCSGTGYVFSTDVAIQVYNISENVPFIKLEDVFIGLCLAELNIRLEELHSQQTFFTERLSFSTCRFKKIVTCHRVKANELLAYWKALEKSLHDEECPDFSSLWSKITSLSASQSVQQLLQLLSPSAWQQRLVLWRSQ